jgi:hypothetical protein
MVFRDDCCRVFAVRYGGGEHGSFEEDRPVDDISDAGSGCAKHESGGMVTGAGGNRLTRVWQESPWLGADAPNVLIVVGLEAKGM